LRGENNILDSLDDLMYDAAADEEQANFTELKGASITAYAASIFQRLRLLDGINYRQILKSLNPNKNRNQIFSSGEGAGASGAFLFFSHDRRFLVKTISEGEL